MGKTLLLLAFVVQTAYSSDVFLDTLKRAFKIGTAETHYVLVVDASADPQMRKRWADVRSAIIAVATSIPRQSRLDVMTFEESTAVVYSGIASDLSLDAFPVRPRGMYTDWGKALEEVYNISEAKTGVGIVFTISICCIPGVDEPSPQSLYAKPNSSAWDSLSFRARSEGKNIYYVPVMIEGATFTYPELIAKVAGKEKVLTSNVSLRDLSRRITDIQKMVLREVLEKAVRSDLERGSMSVFYSLKGDAKERLSLSNNYQFLSVKIQDIDSICGQLMHVPLEVEDRKAFKNLTIGARDTIGPIEKAHVKGPKKVRWDASFYSQGLWLTMDALDTIRVYGDIDFLGSSEIKELGLTTKVSIPLGVVRVKRLNYALLGSGIGTFVLILALIAWSRGRARSNAIKK